MVTRGLVKDVSELENNFYCGVAQLVERRTHNPQVVGSIPAPATKFPTTVVW